MPRSKIIAVSFQTHTKHTNTLCGHKVEFRNVNLALYIVTTGLWTLESDVTEGTIGNLLMKTYRE